MESILVNARVPAAKKEAANRILKSIGSTPSELINSAYDFLLEFKTLPDATPAERPSAEAFASFVANSSFDADWGPESEAADYKGIVRSGKVADYESLA